MVSNPPVASSNAKTSADDYLTPRRFAALLGLLIVASFAAVVAGFETFFFADYGQFGYPLAFYYRESLWRGEVPLWNPLNHCGVPFLAQWNTMTLYPLSLLLLPFPLSWSLGVLGLAHLLLAGMGMYFLAHRWTGNRLAAAAAGTAFAFNGLTWYGLQWPNHIAALAWMPWVILTLERAWRDGGRFMVLAALAGAMQMLSGGAEVVLQTWLLLGVLGLAQLFRAEISRAKLIGRTLGVGCLMAGLTAAQLLPFLDLVTHSQRVGATGHAATTGIAAMPLTGWLNYLVPLFHCSRNALGVPVQAGQPWLGSYYLGVGIVALAVLAVWRERKRRAWLLMAVAFFGLFMAFGDAGLVYTFVKRAIPLFGLVRFPVKFVVLATFVIPLLAACGLGWLQALTMQSWTHEWKRATGLALVLLGLMAGIVGFAWKYPLAEGDTAATAVNAVTRALFLVCILGCVWGLRHTKDLARQRLLQAGLILFLWLDVYTHAPNLSPTVARSVYEPDAIRRFFKWDHQLQAGVSRAMQGKTSFWRMLSDQSANPEVDTTGRRLSLFMDFNLLDHVPKLDGFYPLDLKEPLDVCNQVYFTTNEAAKLKDFLGISHISNPTNPVDWIARDSFLPMITAGQKPVFANGLETLQRLLSDRFEPLRTVYLPLEARSQTRASGPANARIISSQFSPHRLGIEVEADAPAMVVVAQAFYHPWHAYVDGKPTPLWRANYAYQALEIPSGKHQVSLVYEDKMFCWGVILSLAAMLACGAGWVCCRPSPD